MSDLIALIKVEYLHEDIYWLIEELKLDQVKIDKQVERIEHAMSMPTKTKERPNRTQTTSVSTSKKRTATQTNTPANTEDEIKRRTSGSLSM